MSAIARSSCPHPLPVTNGWVSWTDFLTNARHVSVYCGKCHEDVVADDDQDWNERYFDRLGYYPLGDPPKPKRSKRT